MLMRQMLQNKVKHKYPYKTKYIYPHVRGKLLLLTLSTLVCRLTFTMIYSVSQKK